MQRRTFLKFSAFSLASVAEAKSSDIILNNKEKMLVISTEKKIKKVRRYVGFGNFNIISFDDMIKISKRVKGRNAFTKNELALMDRFFYEDPTKYGFYGERTCEKISKVISKKDVIKIPKTGHYLYRGTSKKNYEKILQDVGKSLILTSGVRGVPKQMSLYLGKIVSCDGNISLASNSIAPPGYSYHSIGDFDVGKIGWGHKNFTASFARTEEFWKLTKLPYISMRYTINNLYGVRFEPWHVKIS